MDNFVGIDLSKMHLDVAVEPSGSQWHLNNDGPGRQTLVNCLNRRLKAQGKASKLALVACMRKLLTILNAMLKHHTPWQSPPLAT